MPYYVEFPTDPVVDVHWKSKKDEPPPLDPDGFPFQTCGGYYDHVPRLAYIVTPTGIRDIHGFLLAPDIYLWNDPAGGFTAEIRAQLTIIDPGLDFPNCLAYGLDVGLRVIRNRDPRTITQEEWLFDGPTRIDFPGQILQGGPEEEIWPPILLVLGGVTSSVIHTGSGPCNPQTAQLTSQLLIQAHCENETFGGPPPTYYGPQPSVPDNLKYPWEV